MPPSPVQIINYVATALGQLTSQFTKPRPDAIIVATGTGIQHITAGVADVAAYIGTAGQVLVTNGGGTDTSWVSTIPLANQAAPTGTGLVKVSAGAWVAAGATLVDADVNAAAAIAGTKVLPAFGAQAISGTSIDANSAGFFTVGVGVATGLQLGNTTAGIPIIYGSGTVGTAGVLRLPDFNGVTRVIGSTHGAFTDMPVLSLDSTGFKIVIGDLTTAGTVWGTIQIAANACVYRAIAHSLQNQSGSLDYLVADATAIHGGVPFAGSSADSKPFALLGTGLTIPMAADANQTLTAAQYQCPVLAIVGGTTLTATRNIVLPRGGYYVVFNGTTGAQALQFIAASGTGITVANGKRATIYDDGTNYVRVTADT